MHTKVATTVASLVLTLALGSATGCRSASTVAAAGAAGTAAIVLNDQNAEAEIAGSLTQVDGRAKRVFASMGLLIQDAAMEDNATEWEYEARSGDRVVHIKLERLNPTLTKVAISSRVGTTLNYDVSHARMVIERIRQER